MLCSAYVIILWGSLVWAEPFLSTSFYLIPSFSSPLSFFWLNVSPWRFLPHGDHRIFLFLVYVGSFIAMLNARERKKIDGPSYGDFTTDPSWSWKRQLNLHTTSSFWSPRPQSTLTLEVPVRSLNNWVVLELTLWPLSIAIATWHHENGVASACVVILTFLDTAIWKMRKDYSSFHGVGLHLIPWLVPILSFIFTAHLYIVFPSGFHAHLNLTRTSPVPPEPTIHVYSIYLQFTIHIQYEYSSL